MSMFMVTGTLANIFTPPPFTDKETGAVSESKAKIQLIGSIPLQGGDVKMDLISLSVTDRFDYDKLKGKKIRVGIGIFASKGEVIYFIPKGTVPELVV